MYCLQTGKITDSMKLSLPRNDQDCDTHMNSADTTMSSVPVPVLLNVSPIVSTHSLSSSTDAAINEASSTATATAAMRDSSDKDKNKKTNPSSLSLDQYYKKLYFSNPCVPVDFPTIQQALDYCPPGKTVTLLPGIYHEKVQLVNTENVTLRAAFPDIGASLVYGNVYGKPSSATNTHGADQRSSSSSSFRTPRSSSGMSHQIMKDTPTIHLSGPHTKLTLTHLQILHYTLGNDIWSGNCAVFVDYYSSLSMHNCDVQSDSGRGVVATKGGKVEIHESIIHDCAATGLYVGDPQSVGVVVKSNIIRNGFGTRRPNKKEWFSPATSNTSPSSTAIETDMDVVDINHAMMIDGPSLAVEIVPPGHSGMYVETANASVMDCLISANSLTGLSVVDNGRCTLSGSDITKNGAEPITVIDEALHVHPMINLMGFPVPLPARERNDGGLTFGPEQNNFSSGLYVSGSSRSGDSSSISSFATEHVEEKETHMGEFGGRLRNVAFLKDAVENHMSLDSLRRRYK